MLEIFLLEEQVKHLLVFIFINCLKKKKFKPAIIRKYYSSHLDEVNFTKSKVKQFFYKKDRASSILEAEQKRNNIIIMDDGLQDISIKKDLNIICFNSSDLVGNELLLPAGPLRDRITKVKDCQIVVINGKRNTVFEKKLKQISNNLKIFQSNYIIRKLNKFRGKKMLAFAGIGNPDNFFNLLKENGLKINEQISFPDHYNYSKEEIKNLLSLAKSKKLNLVTTEKDYFRIKKLGFKKISYVSVDLKIINLKSFEKEILRSI